MRAALHSYNSNTRRLCLILKRAGLCLWRATLILIMNRYTVDYVKCTQLHTSVFMYSFMKSRYMYSYCTCACGLMYRAGREVYSLESQRLFSECVHIVDVFELGIVAPARD